MNTIINGINCIDVVIGFQIVYFVCTFITQQHLLFILQAHIDLAIYHNNEKVHNNNDPMKNDDRLKQGRPKTDSKI